jgi:hypothetical protein
MASWALFSNSGRESVRWDPHHGPGLRRANTIVCDISLAGQYFGHTLGEDVTELRDYTVQLKGLAIGVEELERIASFLESWLRLPLAEQARSKLALDCAVGGLFDQSLMMSLGPRADVLSGGNPVATFRFVAGRLKGELTFVTDPSCLRRFCEGIRASMSEWPEKSGAS